MSDQPRDPDQPEMTPEQTERLREELASDTGIGQRAEEAMRREGPMATLKERQPGGLFLLFVVEMWERFSYYGMRALLTLYMVAQLSENGLGFERATAGKIYGWYTSLVYLTPVFGGMLADKLIGTHRSMVIGGVIIAMGHFTLALIDLFEPGSKAAILPFWGGLGLIIIGTGFFKPCVSVMVGQLYREGDSRRDAGFTIFYMGINVGAFLGALACGWLAQKYGWHIGFGAAGVGMVLGLIVYFIGRPKFLRGIGLPPADRGPALPVIGKILGLMVAFGALVVGYVIAKGYGYGGMYIAVAALGALGAVSWFVSIQKPGEKGPTAALFIISFFVIFFWYAFEQAGSSMNVFADQRTNREWVFGEFPAAWFQSVNPFYIIAFAPIFGFLWLWLGRRRLEPSTPVKMSYGLILLGLGFVFMVLGAYSSDGGTFIAPGEAVSADGQASLTLVAPYWLLGAYLLHTWGELMLSPIGLSLVTKLAPRQWVSLMMGVWFLAPAIAQLIGGYTFAYIEPIETGEAAGFPIIGGQADFFLIFVITSVGAGLVMLLISPILRRLIAGKG